MRLLEGTVSNFGSYKDLKFDFSKQGLTLIQGATGAGKSTLADIAGWILYGITAKGGNVDDVRNWTNPGEVTYGTLSVEITKGTTIQVTRARGPKPKDNDLYWQEDDYEELRRGKDIQDTQKLLEKALGVSADIYFASAYFNEFSNSASFFVAKAKERRELFEKIANLDMPKILSARIVDERKPIRTEIIDFKNKLSKEQGRIETIEESILSAEDFSNNWQDKKTNTLKSLEAKHRHFEKLKSDKIEAIQLKQDSWQERLTSDVDKAVKSLNSIEEKLAALDIDNISKNLVNLDKKIMKAKESKCPECGAPEDLSELYEAKNALQIEKEKWERLTGYRETSLEAIDALLETENPFIEAIQAAKIEVNHYAAEITREKAQINPHAQSLQEFKVMLNNTTSEIKGISAKIEALADRLNLLDRLYDLSSNLRGALLEQAVRQIEEKTNGYLERYFDAEIRIGLTLDPSGDSLEVSIQKSGYECNYKQLSKGQRGLLKLTFAVALMSVTSDKAGVHFDNLWFDESLDGLDDSLKVKAFDLFTELAQEHNSVFVIDHAESLKQLFEQSYYVDLVEDCSVLT